MEGIPQKIATKEPITIKKNLYRDIGGVSQKEKKTQQPTLLVCRVTGGERKEKKWRVRRCPYPKSFDSILGIEIYAHFTPIVSI